MARVASPEPTVVEGRVIYDRDDLCRFLAAADTERQRLEALLALADDRRRQAEMRLADLERRRAELLEHLDRAAAEAVAARAAAHRRAEAVLAEAEVAAATILAASGLGRFATGADGPRLGPVSELAR